MNQTRFAPISWPAVLLVALPGLLLALSRLNLAWLQSILGLALFLILLLPILAAAVLRWRGRGFPVWALLPGGALAWLLVYLLATGIVALSPVRMRLDPMMVMNILQLALAVVLFAALLPGRRLPRNAWSPVGLVVLAFMLVLVLLSRIYPDSSRFLTTRQYLFSALSGAAEGLFLVALGLLAARRHGVLAVPAILGGYVYMFMDSDYLFGYPQRDWPWLQFYLANMVFLFMVVAPVALLRARTTTGRAAGLFIPVVLVLVGRLLLPAWVVSQPVNGPGDVMISVNVLLSLLLGWALYSRMSGAAVADQPGGPALVPSSG